MIDNVVECIWIIGEMFWLNGWWCLIGTLVKCPRPVDVTWGPSHRGKVDPKDNLLVMAIDCRVHQALSIRAYTDERSIRTFLTSDLWPEGPLERRCQAGIRCRYPFEQAIRGSFHILDSLIIPRLPPAKFSTSQYKPQCRTTTSRLHGIWTYPLVFKFAKTVMT